MSTVLSMCLSLAVTAMAGVPGGGVKLDKSWTSPDGLQGDVTQVQKQQEPADAGSGTAERAGLSATPYRIILVVPSQTPASPQTIEIPRVFKP